MANKVSESENIRIYVDDIFIASATDMSIDRSKTVTRTDVIGTNEQRISDGTIELSGSLTELKSNDLGFKLVRNASKRNAETQPLYHDGVGDAMTGTNSVQRTINTGNLSEEQDFTAVGTSLDHIRLLLKKTGAFTEDLTLKVFTIGDVQVGSDITVPNSKIDANAPFWVEIDLTEAEKITGLTIGTQYTLELSVTSTSGTLDWYGAEYQPNTLILTAAGGETNVDLLHDSVDSATLFVKLNDNVLGQLEGYSFSDGTGTGGLDEIVFDSALTAADEVRVAYEFDDAVENPGAWRLVFSEANNPVYTIRVDEVHDGVLIDSYTINNVRFSGISRDISPNDFVRRTLNFDGQSETPLNF